jgi:hypothetical protein
MDDPNGFHRFLFRNQLTDLGVFLFVKLVYVRKVSGKKLAE